MKILMYAIFPADGKTPKGGVETATFNLLCGFRDMDVNVLALSFNKGINESKEIPFADNIKVILIPYKYNRSTILEIILHSKKILKSIYNEYRPDIVHIQGNGSRLFTRKVFKRTPVVATPHANLKNEYKNIHRKGERLNYKIMMYAEKTNIHKLNGIIYIADFYKKYFETHYNKLQANGQTIFNAVHPDFYKPTEVKVNKTGLVYVGVINARKNLLCLLKALDNIKKDNIDFSLHIIGGYAEGNYKQIIENFISQNNLKSNIIFHGWKSQQEVKDILLQNNAFVLSSNAEGLPISIGEAMALGKIVVSSDVGGISEIIQNNENGFLFKANDDEKLKEILGDVLTKSNDEIHTRAQQTAIENHSPVEVAKKTLTFYNRVLALTNFYY